MPENNSVAAPPNNTGHRIPGEKDPLRLLLGFVPEREATAYSWSGE